MAGVTSPPHTHPIPPWKEEEEEEEEIASAVPRRMEGTSPRRKAEESRVYQKTILP